MEVNAAYHLHPIYSNDNDLYGHSVPIKTAPKLGNRLSLLFIFFPVLKHIPISLYCGAL